MAAAILHASWNALVKSGGDPLMRMGIVVSASGILGLIMIPFTGIPSPASWSYIFSSVVIHQAYLFSVCFGYRFGDLSQVYPIQRGVSPIMVAVGGYLIVGETLNTQGMIAVSVICLAILSLAFGRNFRFTGGRAVPIALLTGVLIAGYTVVDGVGGRLSGNVFGYIAWLSALEAIPIALLVLWMVKRNPQRTNRRHVVIGIGGGVMAFCAYGMVIWAMSLSHLTYVSALRETSVILAAWIGSRILHEPFGKHRIVASSFVAIGVLLLQVSDVR